MEYALTEQQKILQQSARDFLRKEVPPALVKEMSEDKVGFVPGLWRKMADMGWMGIAVPEAYGGFSTSFVDLILLLEEMGRVCLPGPYFSTVALAAETLLQAGSKAQKQDFLPALANGDLPATVAVAEAEATYDPKCFRVEARRVGSNYEITGTKLFVPDAHVAAQIICLAKTDPGLTLFIVDAKAAGLTCTMLPTMAGDKQCEVNFDHVVIPEDRVLGAVGDGWQHWQKVFAKAAVAKCAELVGGAQQALEMTLGYAKDRVQFGKPIGSFQAIQHHLVNMLSDVECSKYLTYQAAWMLDEGLPCAKEVAMAKAYASEAGRRVAALGVQIHGAIAFCWEHDLHLYYKQAHTGRLLFGDSDFHEDVVAQELGL